MANILIVYYSYDYPLRAAVADHLYAFQRYASHRCFYLNLAVRRLPGYLHKMRFDLIVFHTIFLWQRSNPRVFHSLVEKLGPLKQLDGVKIALPQDEFLCTDALCDFINEFGIQYVFSVAPPSEWPKIYNKVDRSKTKFFKILTGYLDQATIARIERLAQSIPNRLIDIGYRAKRDLPCLGRHGKLKTRIAEVFQENAPRRGLMTDISTRAEDTLLGDMWYQFLLKCKFTIGVEGGASILDKDGTIRQRTEAYLRRQPQASFDEVEACCFPGLDGSIQLFAISPRHLEACATRTCQILIEGEYDGILKPGMHYIELKPDFGNLEEVLELVKKDTLRARLTKRAYHDIVESERYTYQTFVNFVLEHALQSSATAHDVVLGSGKISLIFLWACLEDILSWRKVALYRLFFSFKRWIRQGLVALFSEEWVLWMMCWLRRVGREKL